MQLRMKPSCMSSPVVGSTNHCFTSAFGMSRLTRSLLIPQQVVPTALRPELLYAYHGHVTTGHKGVNRIREAMAQTVWWPKITSDIKRNIQGCRCLTGYCELKSGPARSVACQCSHHQHSSCLARTLVTPTQRVHQHQLLLHHLQQPFELQEPETGPMLAVRLDFSKHSKIQFCPPLAQSRCSVTSGHTASDVKARQSSCANIPDTVGRT